MNYSDRSTIFSKGRNLKFKSYKAVTLPETKNSKNWKWMVGRGWFPFKRRPPGRCELFYHRNWVVTPNPKPIFGDLANSSHKNINKIVTKIQGKPIVFGVFPRRLRGALPEIQDLVQLLTGLPKKWRWRWRKRSCTVWYRRRWEIIRCI